ncbi:hypothetical protein N7495_008429 [Penicillium taxi]|uniref:uncharacterized protein n=1 Tax=Penicillium taxi TaxID=168475 RepID=UPI0025459E49|nr:uncharacterized protein N7495_008429 [Penicillium taxi]KAJ5888388.1 hypothetical protein N7495_008429 [Penicillium taxi]
MHIKNSILLAAALTAGSVVARSHGHERRHAHAKVNIEEPALPVVTDAPELKERAVGDEVFATINGVLESWINEWAGEAASSSISSSTSTTVAAAVEATSTSNSVSVETSVAVESSVSATAVSSTSSSSSWTDYPSDLDFSSTGFGISNYIEEALGIDWKGNTGTPWGSNVIEVEESAASGYRNVFRFEGSSSADWTVIFWNKVGPLGGLNGFFSPNKALTINVPANGVKYVAIDDQSTGGWAAFEGDDCPTSEFGSYAATWGEFTVRPAPETSSWDVSAIIAEQYNLPIQGMKICSALTEKVCSTITKDLGSIENAYNYALRYENGIGGNTVTEAVRLVVNLDYA